MRRVIKAGVPANGLSVSPLEHCLGATPDDRGREGPLPDPLLAENERLQNLIGQKEAEIAGLHKAVLAARKEGEDSGRLAMECELEESRERALELLRNGIGKALEALSDLGERAELLALLLARTAIEKLFGEESARQSIVADLIRHQVRQIDKRSILGVEVSRLDFPDTNEVAGLAAGLNIDPKAVAVSDDLGAGGCRMKLRLGMLDIGLDQQWGALRDLFDVVGGAGECRE
ncbi:MAG: hypothetical protein WCY29_13120 [Novosphingobium sp.]